MTKTQPKPRARIRRKDTKSATTKEVARSRFELLSGDPESPMIDRYTTGLLTHIFCNCCLIKVTEDQEKPRIHTDCARSQAWQALQTSRTGWISFPFPQKGTMSWASRI